MSTKTLAGAPLRGFKSILEGKYFAWILLVPSLVLVVAFIFYPVYRGVYLSFTRTVLLEGPGSTFIGLENFRQMFQDPLFILAAKNTLLFMIVGLITQLTVGLAAAMLLSQERKYIGIIRVLVVLPWFTPPVVTAYMWRFILDGNAGVLTKMLEGLFLQPDMDPEKRTISKGWKAWQAPLAAAKVAHPEKADLIAQVEALLI
jgi:multiple sugar transport system permease protein